MIVLRSQGANKEGGGAQIQQGPKREYIYNRIIQIPCMWSSGMSVLGLHETEPNFDNA
jgi:hypothetical protein